MDILEEKKHRELGSLKARELDSKSLREFAKIFLARKEEGRDFLNSAVHCLEYAAKIDSQDENILIELIDAYIENNQIDKAIKVATQLLKSNKSQDKAYAVLGSLYLSQGEKSKAKLNLEKALILDNYKNINYLRNYFATEELNIEERKFILERASDLLQSNKNQLSCGELHYLIADIYNKDMNYQKAVQHWIKGAELIRNELGNENINLIFKYLETCFKSLCEENLTALKKLSYAQREDYKKAEPKLIFIVGLPRTGSTLIEQILLTNPDLSSVGESNYFAQSLIGELKQDLSEIFYKIKQISKDNITNIRKKYLDFIDQNSKVVIDKTLSNFLYIPIIQSCFPEAQIIISKRDWEETRFSCFTQYFTDSQVAFSYSFADLDKYQNLYENILKRLFESGVASLVECIYEDLITDTETYTQKIFTELALEWSPKTLEFYKNKEAVTTASLTQVRKPIYKSSLKKWERYKDLFEKELVHKDFSK